MPGLDGREHAPATDAPICLARAPSPSSVRDHVPLPLRFRAYNLPCCGDDLFLLVGVEVHRRSCAVCDWPVCHFHRPRIVRGFWGGRKTSTRALGPSQSVLLRPFMQGSDATPGCRHRRHPPIDSVHVGSLRSGHTPGGRGSRLVLPDHWSVPVFCRVQPAPSATIESGLAVDVVGGERHVVGRCGARPQDDVLLPVWCPNHTSSVPVIARISVRPSPLTSPGTTA